MWQIMSRINLNYRGLFLSLGNCQKDSIKGWIIFQLPDEYFNLYFVAMNYASSYILKNAFNLD